METFLNFLFHHGALSSAQYWHLRLLSTIAFGPVLAILYLIFFSWRAPRQPKIPAGGLPTMWVSSKGQLLVRRPHRRAPILNLPTLASPPATKPYPRGW